MEEQVKGEIEPALARPARLLIVATDEVAGPELIGNLRGHLGAGPAEVIVISPAVEKSAFHHALGDVDAASREAQRRLKASLEELGRAGVAALGEVGDSDPVIAAQDALREFDADEVLIVAHAEDQARWFEEGLFERAKAELRPAVRMAALRRDGDAGPPHLAAVEDSADGREPAPGAEREPALSPNLPRFTRGGLAGIAVAIVATIVVIVLAATGAF